MLVSRLLKKLRGKKSRRLKIRQNILRLALVPIGVTLGLVVAWLSMDDFVYYFHAANEAKRQEAQHRDYEFLPWSFDGTYSGDNNVGVPGVDGLRYMLLNQTSGGYYAEYLRILGSHCNWSTMHPEVEQLELHGTKVAPYVSTMIGFMTSESSLETGMADEQRISPSTVLSRDSYKQDGKHTLYAYTSAVAREDNCTTLSSQYFNSPYLLWAGAQLYVEGKPSVRTHMQFNPDYAALYPIGRHVDTAVYWPSKLNGYGAGNGLRTKADTDATFTPDGISIMIQRGWMTLGVSEKYITWERLKDERAANTIAYPMYNYGEAGALANIGLGIPISGAGDNSYWGAGSNWDSRNTLSRADCMAESANWLSALIWKEINLLASDYEGYTEGLWSGDVADTNYWNHADQEGFAVASILLSGGFVVTGIRSDKGEVYDDIVSGYGSSRAGELRGATVAYRLLTGNKDATIDEVAAWLTNRQYNRKTAAWKNENYPGSSDNLIYWTTPNAMVYAKGASKAVPCLHTAYGPGIRAIFQVEVSGVITYWRMLKAAGIECTLADAVKDTTASLVGRTLTDGENGSSRFVSPIFGTLTPSTVTSVMRDRPDVPEASKGVHRGEDLSAAWGTPLAAIRDATVVYTKNVGGMTVKLRLDQMYEDEPAIEVLYMHMSKYAVKPGDHVKAGDLIGDSGNSGGNYKPHLHLEVRVYWYGEGEPTGKMYCVPYSAIFYDKCNVYNSPGIDFDTKTAGALVYGRGSDAVLASDEERTINGKTYKCFTGSLESDAENWYDANMWKSSLPHEDRYYGSGLARYIPLALEQFMTVGVDG